MTHNQQLNVLNYYLIDIIIKLYIFIVFELYYITLYNYIIMSKNCPVEKHNKVSN